MVATFSTVEYSGAARHCREYPRGGWYQSGIFSCREGTIFVLSRAICEDIHGLCSMWRPVAAVSDRVSRWKSIGMIPFDFNFALHRRCKIPKCNSQPSLDRIFPSNAREKPRRRRRASYVADLDAHSRGRFDLIPTRRH